MARRGALLLGMPLDTNDEELGHHYHSSDVARPEATIYHFGWPSINLQTPPSLAKNP